MDFGLFNLLQHRDRSKTSQDLINEALDHTRAAEELGFSRVWFAEHHFSNYSLVPSPLMMCAHVAAITKRIRVGSAVVILPLHTPARLIAEIAMVDALSNGRLDVGVGSGYQNYEFERLGADIANNKVMFHEMLDMIELGLRQPNFSYDGTYFQQKQTAINIRPVQDPRPPIWLAGKDPESHRRCARDGYIPFISGGIGSPKKVRDLRNQIEDCYREEGKDPAGIPIGVLRFLCVSDDRKEVERYVDGARYQGEPPLERVERNILAGDVDTVAEKLCAEIELYGPSHINCYFQVGDVPSATALKSMELLAGKVIPLVEKHFGKPLAEINPAAMPTPKPLALAAE
jgi:alkanesulfonate monooxygenase SsuD/methylene tetrahydromethanopterin reductase-like flavin-dependent oxidoreductase (luciferase family)